MHGSFEHQITAKNNWARLAAVVSVSVALTLIISKLVAWRMSGSAAVLGSLADSALDLIGSMLAFGGVWWAAEPADKDHRFGHNKAEAIAGLAQLILITGSALFVLNESVQRFAAPEPLTSGGIALWVMVLSLALSSGLVFFQSIALRRSGSIAVEGDRAHYVGDLIANGGAIIGILLSLQFGLFRADAVAGLLAAGFLFHAAWSIGVKVIPQLMDEEIAEKDRVQIFNIAISHAEVHGIHALRTRKAGRKLYIQMHLEMDPDLRLTRAHDIADEVEMLLLAEYPEADIILHQDPFGVVEPHDEFGQRPPDAA